MNDQVPTERLGTKRLNDVFLEIHRYEPTLKFHKEEIGFNIHAKLNANL